MRFLVDENLSRALVSRLHELGHEAERVSDIGLSGQPDHVVWREAFDRSAIFITANAEDFISLADGSTLHAGLIVFRAGDLAKDEQVQWLDRALERLAYRKDDIVNHVIEVRIGDADLEIDDFKLPGT